MPRGRALQVAEDATLPIRKSVRRLRWFRASFQDQIDKIAAETGVTYALDGPTLAAAFLDWLRAFEAQKPHAPEDRRAFVGFAAGLMLRTLLRHRPLTATALPPGADATNPAYFWPEGYVCVAYCLNIRSAVLEQDFHEDRRMAPAMGEIRNWWSFRENVAQDPSLGIAFLDLFAGDDPDWVTPDIFQSRDLGLMAPRFFERRSLRAEK